MRNVRFLAKSVATLLLLVVSLVVLLAGNGCAQSPSATASSRPLQPLVVPYRGPTTLVYFGDPTSSYQRDLLLQADTLIANVLDASVQPNTGALTAYITWLNSHPYVPASTPLVIQLPGLPAQPSPPHLTPTPTRSGDPYADANARMKVDRDNALKRRAYQQTLAAQYATLVHVRRMVRQQTDILRRLAPAVDRTATSVYGALALASERLSTVSGAKDLIIASDLQNTTLRDYLPPGLLSLRGVRVRVIFLQCSSAPECRTTVAQWQRVFRAAGVRDVDMAFYDPATSRMLSAHTLLGP